MERYLRQVTDNSVAVDRCQRQNRLTIPKLLLSILAIIGHYGRHSTKSYIVALKYTFLIILLLLQISFYVSNRAFGC